MAGVQGSSACMGEQGCTERGMALKCCPAVATCTLLLCNVTMQSISLSGRYNNSFPACRTLFVEIVSTLHAPGRCIQSSPLPSSATALQMPLAEAYQKCRHQWMREALVAWITRQGWQHVLQGQALEARTSDSCSEGC